MCCTHHFFGPIAASQALQFAWAAAWAEESGQSWDMYTCSWSVMPLQLDTPYSGIKSEIRVSIANVSLALPDRPSEVDEQ
jgi:hypothetical protein